MCIRDSPSTGPEAPIRGPTALPEAPVGGPGTLPAGAEAPTAAPASCSRAPALPALPAPADCP
eukprot:1972474-Alexandrium_andersonii.AAC.1